MKVLAYTSPARGHLFPLMPILDELSSRGHELSVRTLASQVPMLRERGFDAKPISADVEAIEHDDFLGKTPPARVKRAMRPSREGRRTTVQTSTRRSPMSPPMRSSSIA